MMMMSPMFHTPWPLQGTTRQKNWPAILARPRGHSELVETVQIKEIFYTLTIFKTTVLSWLVRLSPNLREACVNIYRIYCVVISTTQIYQMQGYICDRKCCPSAQIRVPYTDTTLKKGTSVDSHSSWYGEVFKISMNEMSSAICCTTTSIHMTTSPKISMQIFSASDGLYHNRAYFIETKKGFTANALNYATLSGINSHSLAFILNL